MTPNALTLDINPPRAHAAHRKFKALFTPRRRPCRRGLQPGGMWWCTVWTGTAAGGPIRSEPAALSLPGDLPFEPGVGRLRASRQEGHGDEQACEEGYRASPCVCTHHLELSVLQVTIDVNEARHVFVDRQD